MKILDKALWTAALAMAALTGATAAANAQENMSLADLATDAAMAQSFKAMAGTSEIPDWVGEGIVTTPAQKVRFDGKEWMAMQGCQQHDCATNQIAVIYAPESGAMFGVLSTLESDSGPQVLRWLGMGGGAETIDGRTILFAALSGSLANHPDAFSYDD